ncbi:MAG TPA: ATP-binding protein [Thermoanaerobaculia bacterium]|nr:ATP-binding protein [Thermoanaerobaculia bacterium]
MLRHLKDPRLVVALPLVLILFTSFIYYLIQRANELSPEALGNRLLLFVLWNINLILLLGILLVLLRGLIKAILERKRGILGSRFRSKLIVTYIAITILPVALLFIIATDFLRVSIDRWFNSPVETILRNSEAVAEVAMDGAMEKAEAAAREIAASGEGDVDEVLDHVRRFHSVSLVGVYERGAVLKIVADPRAPVHRLAQPAPGFFEEVARRGSSSKIDNVTDGKWLRAGVRMAGGRAAVGAVFIPSDTSRMLDENVIAWHDYQALEIQRPVLKAAQTSLFLTITLAILFFALLVAIYVSRRITVPITALAAGTRTLAAGDYRHRIDVEATDEFGVLVDSFNTMAERLEAQQSALSASNIDLAEERAFLSTVLGSVSAGVVAFDDELRLLSMNPSAQKILEIDDPQPGTPLGELLVGELSVLADSIRELAERGGRSRELSLVRGGEIRYLEISVAPLEGRERGGRVVAIEDLTRLVQAQKLAAWSEAARRIAHEIKNPLTPIQLSAERIARKLRRGDPDLAQAVEQGCRTIVNEVGQLERMVDEFSRFARMPAIHLRESDIGTILADVATLYRDVKPSVTIAVQIPERILAVVDPEQIRRALINLLDNAIEATAAGTITLSARREDRRIVVEVVDTGRGVPDDDKEKLFLPYFSTKRSGTGLGLAIVHRVVHDHDGTISVHDHQPRGTRFRIEIPA